MGSEIDSAMSSCCCFLLRLLFLVLKSAYARWAVREPGETVIAPTLRLGGYPFFQSFLGAVCSLVFAIVYENGLQNELNMKTFGSYLLEKVCKLKSVFGLRRRARIAYYPILWNARGDPKIEEKKDIFQKHFFSKCKNV